MIVTQEPKSQQTKLPHLNAVTYLYYYIKIKRSTKKLGAYKVF